MPYKKSTQKKYGDNPLQKKSAFTLKSGNNIGGRNGRDVNFKQMGGDSPVKQTNFIGSFTNFLFNTKQTEEGRAIGDLKRRMRSPNIEIRMKAQRENRERLKKAREAATSKTESDFETIAEEAAETQASKWGEVEEATETEFKPHEFTRGGGDPYSYRTKKASNFDLNFIPSTVVGS